MRRANNTEQIIKENLSFTASAAMHNRILNDALAAQEQAKKTKSGLAQANLWRTVMKSPLTKLATAAIVAIACLIGLSLWRGTESGIALADVLARIEQVKAFRCQLNTKVTGEDPNKPYNFEAHHTVLISQEYGWKGKSESLDPNGGWSTFQEYYRLPDKKTMISILHKQKKYSRIEFDDRWVEEWQKKTDPRTLLKKIAACKHESLGRSTIDGIEVEGFQTTDPNWLGNSENKVEVDVKMWVDAKTRLPVRHDFTNAWFDQMGDKIIRRQHSVMHDFQWDVRVDAAEFEPPPVPDGYTSLAVKFPAHITEETAIEGLKILVELLGKYPDPEIITLGYFDITVLRSALEKSETPAATRLKEEIKGLTDEEIGNKLVDFLMPIRGLARFYWKLGLDKKNPAYYGKAVTPKDADKVLMRWKVSDSEYRVIYGDLHAETVSAEKLAELEAALPK
jgi:hypothetical protein